MKGIVPSRRLLVTIAVATAAGVASAVGVGYAQEGSSQITTVPAAHGSAGSILSGIHAGLAQLVARGTISQPQADAVEQEATSGSIDPKTLVANGVVSDPQMRVIADMIDQLKQAGG